MIDPVRERQLQELDTVGICTRILYQARSELYVNMHFLDVSLSSLGFEADWGRNGISTDGAVIFYDPEFLLNLYKKGRVCVNRAYLHMVFHCLFCHMYTRKGRKKDLWDLACDIAMEAVIDGLYQKCVHVPQSPLRRETYLRLKRQMEEPEEKNKIQTERLDGRDGIPKQGRTGSKVLTAERIYRALSRMELSERRLGQLQAEFKVDDHDLWEQDENSRQAITRQNQWNDKREKCRLRWKLWVLRMSHRKMKAFRICFGQKTGSGTITASFSGVFLCLKRKLRWIRTPLIRFFIPMECPFMEICL